MDRLEKLWQRRNAQPIWIRTICEAKKLPYQGLSEIAVGIPEFLDVVAHEHS
jgi:hypothetical protein